MHPECRASLSIVEKLIQYYPISPGLVVVTHRARSCAVSGHMLDGYETLDDEPQRRRDSGDFSIPPVG